MDTTVFGVGCVVLDALQSAGYAESTLGRYRRLIRYFVRFAGGGDVEYTPELGVRFSCEVVSERTGKFSTQRAFDFPRIAYLFDSALSGSVNLSQRKRGGGGVLPVSVEFMAVLTQWEVVMLDRGLAAATREAYRRVARAYLVFLESCGVSSIDDATGASILGFLESLLARWQRSSLFWVASNFRPFLRFLGREDLVAAVGLAGVKRHHRIVEVLPDGDKEKVIDACVAGWVSARDAAVALLALSTGLRACDIVSLRLGDIDWRSFTISLVQQKTGNALTLPMTGLLAEKLGVYLLDERPRVDHDYVFTRSVAPFTRLSGHASVHRLISKVFRQAGAETSNVGASLLRRNVASRLLAAGTPLATISAVLGHSSPDSTSIYLSTDMSRMRECVLPLPLGEVLQ